MEQNQPQFQFALVNTAKRYTLLREARILTRIRRRTSCHMATCKIPPFQEEVFVTRSIASDKKTEMAIQLHLSLSTRAQRKHMFGKQNNPLAPPPL